MRINKIGRQRKTRDRPQQVAAGLDNYPSVPRRDVGDPCPYTRTCRRLCLGSRTFCNVHSLRALRALGDLELYRITLLQALITFRGNPAVMYKNIGSPLASNKTVSLGIVEPLHRTFQTFHARPLKHCFADSNLLLNPIGCNSPAMAWGCQGGSCKRSGYEPLRCSLSQRTPLIVLASLMDPRMTMRTATLSGKNLTSISSSSSGCATPARKSRAR